jgi:hypothetical protein
MRLSKASPPSTPTAAAQPSPSPNSAPKAAQEGLHAFVIAIFFLLGTLALVLTAFFSNRNITNSNAALRAGRYTQVTLFDQALASPSTFFAIAMILAGLTVWNLQLIPRGIHFSFGRVSCGAILAVFIYPVGFIAILFAVFGGDALLHQLGLDQPNSSTSDWSFLLGAIPMAAILCAGGMLTIVLAALALALATRWWPRRVLLWSFGGSAGILFCSFVFSLVRQKLLFPTIPLWSDLVHHTGDMLVFSFIWNIPTPVVIGEPILAALLGHWFYRAAVEWSADPAH